jgi:hypothetical protein
MQATVSGDGTTMSREDDDVSTLDMHFHWVVVCAGGFNSSVALLVQAVLEAGILLLGNLTSTLDLSPEDTVALSTVSDCLQSVLFTAPPALVPNCLYSLSQLSFSQDTAK